ncbi:MAG: hypothetical protein AAGC68_02005, partial [Verrucomicrobiota bacterium]
MNRFFQLCFFAVLALGIPAFLSSTETPNFESPHVHPLDISPNGSTLAICNTRDNRIELYSIGSGGGLSNHRSLFTGIDPVSVRFRSNSELWVVNHVSDSISIVDLTEEVVADTLQTFDEPCDVVFAG